MNQEGLSVPSTNIEMESLFPCCWQHVFGDDRQGKIENVS